jgi:gas vesicle protein
MRQFMLGCLVGGVLMASVSALAEKDRLGRSPQQQKFDYFRERQQQLDIGHMRQQLDRQEFDRKLGRKPC